MTSIGHALAPRSRSRSREHSTRRPHHSSDRCGRRAIRSSCARGVCSSAISIERLARFRDQPVRVEDSTEPRSRNTRVADRSRRHIPSGDANVIGRRWLFRDPPFASRIRPSRDRGIHALPIAVDDTSSHQVKRSERYRSLMPTRIASPRTQIDRGTTLIEAALEDRGPCRGLATRAARQ